LPQSTEVLVRVADDVVAGQVFEPSGYSASRRIPRATAQCAPTLRQSNFPVGALSFALGDANAHIVTLRFKVDAVIVKFHLELYFGM
jgi:hypothetical protein